MNKLNIYIAKLILVKEGIDISRYDDTFMYKVIQRRIEETSSISNDKYILLLEASKKERETFLDSLHICYSEFFRNPLTFSVLEKIILPLLLNEKSKSKRKDIRIWSTACAEGQEAYSVAMLIEEFISSKIEESAYRIFATDQCESELTKAVNGQYNVTALNNLVMKRLKRWFIKQGDVYVVKSDLKKNIDFSVFDLFDEQLSSPASSIFGDFDMVFCSNLLFYYKTEYRKIILAKAGNSLKSGGYIIVGETERDILFNFNYKEVYPHSAIFQKK